ncbi:DNA-binding protein [Aeromicrobium sp. SMF47]|uniref:DNA-binding protein n=1 Tax=Aeromicrobium yanjiei TaxID=2662028 RepID=A0A5Q2MFQ7_9ACTN|nr:MULTISPECIES: DNA-binding protein [Aeromicrobium]MRJ75007.1 DNA-binding protein [Aeromicrobium yanjiei]MRK02938.1 DNA-binding protein [Aeromicrobium sp. S22]QGG40501.1 DNA-binding protein [Aeromicrobium yanjiei]
MDGRAAQAEIYGEPLGDILGRCARVLGMNQSQLAGILGISAPMLSQLINARRVKIGHPVAAQRLQVLHDAVDAVERGAMGREDALARVALVHGGGDILTTRRSTRDDAVAEIQDLFRRVAGAPDHLDAAERLADTHPDIAEMLRVYGAGRTAEAREHLESLRDPGSR